MGKRTIAFRDHECVVDLVLDAAITGGCDFVVSFNERHLRAAREFGIEVLKPAELLKLIGEIK
jgi:hypothetical protein